MKWPQPQHGDRRIYRRFAFLPVRLTDEQAVVWLCSYWLTQRYDDWRRGEWRPYRVSLTPPPAGWES